MERLPSWRYTCLQVNPEATKWSQRLGTSVTLAQRGHIRAAWTEEHRANRSSRHTVVEIILFVVCVCAFLSVLLVLCYLLFVCVSLSFFPDDNALSQNERGAEFGGGNCAYQANYGILKMTAREFYSVQFYGSWYEPIYVTYNMLPVCCRSRPRKQRKHMFRVTGNCSTEPRNSNVLNFLDRMRLSGMCDHIT